MRAVHGDSGLAGDLLALRDAITYAEPPVPVAATLELFDRQAAAKTKTAPA